MPGRKVPLIAGECYHVFNRGNNRQSTFITPKDFERALLTLSFYQKQNPPKKLSHFLALSKEDQQEFLVKINAMPKHAAIVAYCFMPNHFHAILKQLKENGVSKFMSNFQNSYTKYFNAKHKRSGSLFSRQFKAVRIETEEQLLHLTRYIHLNPYSGYVIKEKKKVLSYLYSSISNYMGRPKRPQLDLSSISNLANYKEFVLSQADCQRSLEKIKHLTLEDRGFK